ncbi:hypothetical protein LINPERPRIM_LOCUS30034 [Linum perenne]
MVSLSLKHESKEGQRLYCVFE